MATFKHISSKNADYGAAEQYLTFEHDEFTMKPTPRFAEPQRKNVSAYAACLKPCRYQAEIG